MEAMENIRIVLAENIKAIRKRKGKMSQDTLAEGAGLSVGMIKQVELGNRWPSPATMEAIAKGLGVTISELFNRKPEGEHKGEVLKISVTVKKLLSIPDEVYDLAVKLNDPSCKEWKDIESALQYAIEKKEKSKKSS